MQFNPVYKLLVFVCIDWEVSIYLRHHHGSTDYSVALFIAL
jgi:hypothetical protein